jgi:hypothetical protein
VRGYARVKGVRSTVEIVEAFRSSLNRNEGGEGVFRRFFRGSNRQNLTTRNENGKSGGQQTRVRFISFLTGGV